MAWITEFLWNQRFMLCILIIQGAIHCLKKVEVDKNGKAECYVCSEEDDSCADWTGDQNGDTCDESTEQACFTQAVGFRVAGESHVRWRVRRGCDKLPKNVASNNYSYDTDAVMSKTAFQTNKRLDYIKVIQIVCVLDLCNDRRFKDTTAPDNL
ncbi:uncharacterized protein LOC129597526 [Paramacrobiotus metropolitanus]|uniref:uncharacterized protein LOC129597526 n=1 Tax=Paramacrobiotus metropolitanus TaxID=2943436 RepID=UPI002445859B|nr:uncharacterized protein LOC129597526 [Paramacrobiotus metropolitanus]